MSSIQITLINESNDQNNSSIVIFQKNKNEKINYHVKAWHVIKNIGIGWSHTINYAEHVEIVAMDSWKNISPKFIAKPGQSIDIVKTLSGDQLQYNSVKSGKVTTDIQLLNKLESASMDALIYRNGKLLVEVNEIAPGESTVFNFEPTIYIGVISDVSEGESMDSAVVNSITTKLSLKGIESGKIIMTGGGVGSSAIPFNFELVTD